MIDGIVSFPVDGGRAPCRSRKGAGILGLGYGNRPTSQEFRPSHFVTVIMGLGSPSRFKMGMYPEPDAHHDDVDELPDPARKIGSRLISMLQIHVYMGHGPGLA